MGAEKTLIFGKLSKDLGVGKRARFEDEDGDKELTSVISKKARRGNGRVTETGRGPAVAEIKMAGGVTVKVTTLAED